MIATIVVHWIISVTLLPDSANVVRKLMGGDAISVSLVLGTILIVSVVFVTAMQIYAILILEPALSVKTLLMAIIAIGK